MNWPNIKRKYKVRIFLRGGQIATIHLKEFSISKDLSNSLTEMSWEGSPLALSYTRLDSVDRIETHFSWRFYVKWGNA